MKTALLCSVLAGCFIADEAGDKAITKDQKQIEGTWQVTRLVIGGDKAPAGDITKMKVINGADGIWALQVDGKEIAKGTSSIDPSQKTRTIDFTITEGDGKGEHHLGIYELGKNARKLCFGPHAKGRPAGFTSTQAAGSILVEFERDKAR